MSITPIELTETHAHLAARSRRDMESMLGQMRGQGTDRTEDNDTGRNTFKIRRTIVPPMSYQSNFSIRNRFNASKDPDIYFTAGIHPLHVRTEGISLCDTDRIKKDDENRYQHLCCLCRDPAMRTVAVGEAGLDFYKSSVVMKDYQDLWLIRQINLAIEFDLPLVHHFRNSADGSTEGDAYREAFQLIEPRRKKMRVRPGVLHCFSGTWEDAKAFCSMGYRLGIGGAFINDDTGRLAEVVRRIPYEWMVLETDTPFLKPETISDNSWGWQCSPTYIPEIIHAIMDLKSDGTSVEEIAQITNNNAEEIFPFDRFD